MHFVYPQFFWVMIVPFAVFVFLVVTNKENVARIFDERVLQRLRADSETLPNSLRNLVLFAAVFLMIVALARPMIPQGEKQVALKGLHAVVALDISGSMRSRDVYPDRLQFAKTKIKELLDAMPTDEIALSAFAHNAFVLAPFTSDKATLKQIVDGVDENYINLASTDFSAMAELAGRLLADKKEKILILFTDGGEPEDLQGLAKTLKEQGITLYAVLVGSAKGAPVLDERGRPMHKRDGTIAITRRNDMLLQIARQTGGEGVVAANGSEDMKALADTIHHHFSAQAGGVVTIREQVELFYYPLAAAALLLLMGLSSMPRSGQRFGFQRGRR
ncbi:vWA domain-containing protein [Nitratifractor sp.]